MAQETNQKVPTKPAANANTAMIDNLVKAVTAAKDRHAKTMREDTSDVGIVAGRHARAAMSELTNLERLRKRFEEGVF